MKKKSNGMSPDMFTDATSSTPIPVFAANNGDKNAPPVKVPTVPDGNLNPNELIPINWDNRTVSARALYHFLGVAERFSKWCKRYFTHRFIENVDYTPIQFWISGNRIAKRDIGDYLLAFHMAKNIAMLQRSEKGIQASNYFASIEAQGADEKKMWQQVDTKSSVQENITLPTTNLVNNGASYQNELIKIDFDKQTVSARALYIFLELEERFSKWCNRMFSYGLVENVDYTTVPNGTLTVPFGTVNVPNGTVANKEDMEEIDDYLLTIDAAKHIAMVQRNEKGKQARNYFINVEKLYLKNVSSKNENPKTSFPLVENFRNLLVQLENEMIQNQQVKKENDRLVEKIIVLERQSVQQETFSNLKEEYLERTISKKIDIALKASFRETDQLRNGDEVLNRLPSATNPNNVVTLNQIEKNLHKTTLEEDLIRKWYRPAERKTENALFLTATEITHHLGFFSKRVTVRNVGIALKKLGFERLHTSVNGNQTKGYFVIRVY